MEITESMIYWITRLDGIKAFLITTTIFFSILSVVVLVVGFLTRFDPCGDKEEKKIGGILLFKVFPLLLVVLVLLSSALVLTPTTKEMCAIKVIPVIANNENAQDLPNKIVELADEWVEELKPKNSNKKGD